MLTKLDNYHQKDANEAMKQNKQEKKCTWCGFWLSEGYHCEHRCSNEPCLKCASVSDMQPVEYDAVKGDAIHLTKYPVSEQKESHLTKLKRDVSEYRKERGKSLDVLCSPSLQERETDCRCNCHFPSWVTSCSHCKGDWVKRFYATDFEPDNKQYGGEVMDREKIVAFISKVDEQTRKETEKYFAYCECGDALERNDLYPSDAKYYCFGCDKTYILNLDNKQTK